MGLEPLGKPPSRRYRTSWSVRLSYPSLWRLVAAVAYLAIAVGLVGLVVLAIWKV